MIAKKRHKLPRFPEHVIPTFEKLCTPFKEGEQEDLRKKTDKYIAHLQDYAQSHKIVDSHLLEEIASRVRVLLDHYDEFPEKERLLIAGAVRYFLCHDDPVSDLAFRSGLHDDARVINYVFEKLCIEEMFIEITGR